MSEHPRNNFRTKCPADGFHTAVMILFGKQKLNVEQSDKLDDTAIVSYASDRLGIFQCFTRINAERTSFSYIAETVNVYTQLLTTACLSPVNNKCEVCILGFQYLECVIHMT